MSIAQRVFLHQRALSTAVIDGFVAQKRAEDEMLEFKAIPWKKGEGPEAAKDVAAFANHLGGDLILGLGTKNDRASGWNPIPNAELVSVENTIRQALITYLRPQEIAEIVEIASVSATKADHSAMVVSVPPFHQLVGVEERASDKLTLQFPIRTGNRTRFFTFDEIMARAKSTTRATFVKLKWLIAQWDHPGVPVIFSSPVYLLTEVGQIPLPTPHAMHAQYNEITADTVTVKLQNISLVKQRDDYGTTPFAYNLTIPLEFVRAAWIDPNERNLEPKLSIALDSDVVWDGSAWKLITSAFR